jgi:hypothetical protein
MEVVVAAISATIALVALVVSWRVSRSQIAIQERVAAIEEARRAEEVAARGQARVTASILDEGWSRLVLHNEGPAFARGVEADIVSLDGDPVPPFNGIHALPMNLQPDQAMEFSFEVTLAEARTVRVTVLWADEAGKHEEPYMLRLG